MWHGRKGSSRYFHDILTKSCPIRPIGWDPKYTQRQHGQDGGRYEKQSHVKSHQPFQLHRIGYIQQKIIENNLQYKGLTVFNPIIAVCWHPEYTQGQGRQKRSWFKEKTHVKSHPATRLKYVCHICINQYMCANTKSFSL